MRVLALDPDSHVCGYAVFDDPDYSESGVFKSRSKDDLCARAMSISDDAETMCRRIDPDWVVIETPGKVQGRATSVLKLQTQSIGVGAVIRAAACGMAPDRVVLVPAHEWTRGQSKEVRARYHAAETGYVGASGLHDVDARCLAAWFAREIVLRKAVV